MCTSVIGAKVGKHWWKKIRYCIITAWKSNSMCFLFKRTAERARSVSVGTFNEKYCIVKSDSIEILKNESCCYRVCRCILIWKVNITWPLHVDDHIRVKFMKISGFLEGKKTKKSTLKVWRCNLYFLSSSEYNHIGWSFNELITTLIDCC